MDLTMKGLVLAAARRLRDEEAGFTMIELLNVVLILGILMLTAAPTYLSTRDKAYKGTASANRFGPAPLAPATPIDTRPGWDQHSELEFVPHSAGPSPGPHVNRKP